MKAFARGSYHERIDETPHISTVDVLDGPSLLTDGNGPHAETEQLVFSFSVGGPPRLYDDLSSLRPDGRRKRRRRK